MQIIKPQAAIIQMARTQIGTVPRLGIAVGVGFRLDDPRILVHETAVWEALKEAAPSVPMFEAALPKRHAEWLVAGHAVSPVPSTGGGAPVEWSASVALHGVRKTVSCVARAAPMRTGEPVLARLAVDARHAASGSDGQNPVGLRASLSSTPLQLIGAFGVSASPLSGMGAIGTDWPARRKWMPRFARGVEAMAEDGSHMGWPAEVDLRYFQQAASDQWLADDVWPAGAAYEMGGFGARGEGYAGQLPLLEPFVLLSRRDGAPVPPLTCVLQTVWFLPDHGIAVLWWNGHVPLAYPLDDQPVQLVVALHDHGMPADTKAIVALAARRTDLHDNDPITGDDSVLMPSMERGWAWDLILTPSDHPRFEPARLSYQTVRERIVQNRESLQGAGSAMPAAPKPDLPALRDTGPDPDATQHWREHFMSKSGAVLRNQTIRSADLTALSIHGWTLVNVAFEDCVIDDSAWRGCQFDNVQLKNTSCVGTQFYEVNWKRGAIIQCRIDDGQWQSTTLESLDVDGCQLNRLWIVNGYWRNVSVQRVAGRDCRFENVRWEAVSWIESQLEAVHWQAIEASGLSLIDCCLPDLQLSDATLARVSVIATDLSGGAWLRNTSIHAVFAKGSSIARTAFRDCVFKSSTWQELHAPQIDVDHGTFIRLSAQRIDATGSRWSMSVLDGLDGAQAVFMDAAFDRCSLAGARLFGADLRGSTAVDCNLTGLQRPWSFPPDPHAWLENLSFNELALPVRRS